MQFPAGFSVESLHSKEYVMRSIYVWLFLVVVAAQGCTPAALPPPKREAPMPTLVAQPAVPMMAVASTRVAEAPVPVPVPEPKAPEVGAEDREKAIAWIMGFMTANAPPGRRTFYTEAQETKEESLTRYRDIASNIVDVVYDSKTKPLFIGKYGRARTVSIIISVMLYESGFMRNVDFGLGKFGRGDHGNSWCMVQLNVGSMGTGRTMKWNTKEDRTPRFGDNPADIFQGFTGPELVQDRHRCIREGLKVMRVSFLACQGMQLPIDQKLRVFAAGKCDENDDAEEKSRLRMTTAMKFFKESAAQRKFEDKAIVEYMTAHPPVVINYPPAPNPPQAPKPAPKMQTPAPAVPPTPAPKPEKVKEFGQSLARTD